MNISAVLITRNAAATLEATLHSLAAFPEVVVYDNGSSDRTAEIAAGFPNVRLFTGDFLGFGPTKNHAAGLATRDWIFSIDADEVVSAELLAALGAADVGDDRVTYAVRRENHLMGRAVRHSGWGRDWLLRLYNRRRTGFSDVPVHENVLPVEGGSTRRLGGSLRHDAVREVGDFLVKANRYSELRRGQGRRVLSPLGIFLRAAWAFLRTYTLRGGFLDGWRGLLIAWSNANGVFYKYMKPYADRAVQRERGA